MTTRPHSTDRAVEDLKLLAKEVTEYWATNGPAIRELLKPKLAALRERIRQIDPNWRSLHE
jgi:hypothetical protein